MLLAFTNASCLRTGFTKCRESPEAGEDLGVQEAFSGKSVISGFSDGTLSGVALGQLTVLTTGEQPNTKKSKFRDSVCAP